MRLKNKIAALLTIFMLTTKSFALQEAPGLNPINSIDWDYYWDSIDWEFKSCVCKTNNNAATTKAGTILRQSEPIAFIDVTNTPWKFPTFDFEFDDSPDRKQGNSRSTPSKTGHSGAFRYTHFIVYPVFAILNFVQDYVCFDRFSAVNLIFLAEIRPDHNNDVIASYIDPIKLLFSNPVAQLACAADCASSSLGSPSNLFPWCAGCWGNIATGTGFTAGQNPVVESALLATRLIDRMHYTYALTKTTKANLVFNMGDVALQDTTCKEAYFPQIIKNQYALQLAYPTVWDAQPIGMHAGLWANFKNLPWTADDFVFALWREREQCLGAYKCESTFTELTGQ